MDIKADVVYLPYLYIYRLTNLVEIKWVISRDGAIQSRFQKGRPSIAELMRASFIVFADSGHSRVDFLPAVHVFNGSLTEEEEYIVVVGH